MPVDLTEPPKLPDWLAPHLPFRRGGVEVNGHRIHLIDEGEGRPVLLLHGNPTWSFLWRKVISGLRGKGLRLIAPDLFGFGLSDHPPALGAHTLRAHVDTIAALVDALDLRELVLVAQDWGGPIGAGMAARLPERVTAVVLGNTSVLAPRRPLRPSTFHRLSHVPGLSPALFLGLGFPLPVLGRVQGDPRSMGPLERRAYAFPFPRVRDRAGMLALARMVPNRDGHPSLQTLDRTDAWLRAFGGPASLVWGLRDPILGRALKRHREALPHAHVRETQAGHFLQEEVPEILAEEILRVAHQR